MTIFRLIFIFFFSSLLLATVQFSYAEDEKPAKKISKAGKTRAEIIKPPVDIQQQFNQDLEHYLTGKTESLLVGTDKFISITQTSNTANNKGVVILIPDWQQSATSPHSLTYLAEHFPDHGWASIIVQPPKKPENYPSVALKTEDRLKENETALKDYVITLTQLAKKLAEKAMEMPGIFIVISEGNHASLFLDIYEQFTSDQPSAFVMLSSYRETENEQIAFAKNLASSSMPVLDLLLTKDHLKVTNSAKLRQKYANNELKVIYRQKQLHNFSTGIYPKATLLKEIQGWLKSIGW